MRTALELRTPQFCDVPSTPHGLQTRVTGKPSVPARPGPRAADGRRGVLVVSGHVEPYGNAPALMSSPTPLLQYEGKVDPDTIRVEPTDDGAVLVLPPEGAWAQWSFLLGSLFMIAISGVYGAAVWRGWAPTSDGKPILRPYFQPTLGGTIGLFCFVGAVKGLVAWYRGERRPRRARFAKPAGSRRWYDSPPIRSVSASRRFPGFVRSRWALRVVYRTAWWNWHIARIPIGPSRAQAEAIAADMRRALGLSDPRRDAERDLQPEPKPDQEQHPERP